MSVFVTCKIHLHSSSGSISVRRLTFSITKLKFPFFLSNKFNVNNNTDDVDDDKTSLSLFSKHKKKLKHFYHFENKDVCFGSYIKNECELKEFECSKSIVHHHPLTIDIFDTFEQNLPFFVCLFACLFGLVTFIFFENHHH